MQAKTAPSAVLWRQGMERSNLILVLVKLNWTKQSHVNELTLHVDGICSLCARLPGLMKLEQFSLDSAALQSILQNEGVKVGGFVGATPQNSVCPSGRGTSIYTVCIHLISFFLRWYFSLPIYYLYFYCGFIYCVASFLRLRECRLESISWRQPEDQQVRCRIVVVVILRDLMHLSCYLFVL